MLASVRAPLNPMNHITLQRDTAGAKLGHGTAQEAPPSPPPPPLAPWPAAGRLASRDKRVRLSDVCVCFAHTCICARPLGWPGLATHESCRRRRHDEDFERTTTSGASQPAARA